MILQDQPALIVYRMTINAIGPVKNGQKKMHVISIGHNHDKGNASKNRLEK